MPPVTAPRAAAARGGGHTPAAVGVFAEQCGEASRRIEAGEAQPVHGTVGADQGRGLQVSHHRVVFDPPRHQTSSVSQCSEPPKPFGQ